MLIKNYLDRVWNEWPKIWHADVSWSPSDTIWFTSAIPSFLTQTYTGCIHGSLLRPRDMAPKDHHAKISSQLHNGIAVGDKTQITSVITICKIS